MNIFDTDSKYIANTYKRFPLAVESGKGSVVKGADGREYIDFGAGIAVNIFGLCDEEWQNAVTEQLSKVAHTSNLYYTAPQDKLAQLLCERTGMSRVFFSNSGAEANECAIKAARKYSFDKYGEGRAKILTLKGSFHGRTIATLTATGQDSFHQFFGPFPEAFDYAEPGNIEDTLTKMDASCAAVMMELVQGEGGVNPLDKEYVETVAAECEKRDILLVIDEVQTGNGRSGELYAFVNYGIKPDIFTTAKGLGGGLPIGATVFGEKCCDTLSAGTHGSTFGGNPVCAAGALNILSRIDDALLEGVKAKSERITGRLNSMKNIESVTGLGLMLGVKTAVPASEVVGKCLEKGLMLLTAKDKVRLLPALNIPDNLIDKGLDILEDVLNQY